MLNKLALMYRYVFEIKTEILQTVQKQIFQIRECNKYYCLLLDVHRSTNTKRLLLKWVPRMYIFILIS